MRQHVNGLLFLMYYIKTMFPYTDEENDWISSYKSTKKTYYRGHYSHNVFLI